MGNRTTNDLMRHMPYLEHVSITHAQGPREVAGGWQKEDQPASSDPLSEHQSLCQAGSSFQFYPVIPQWMLEHTLQTMVLFS